MVQLMSDQKSTASLEALTNLAKRRGFVFQSAELYGGMGAVYDFGPLGTLLKQNIRAAWFKRFVQERDDIMVIESALITKREVLQASGHEELFVIPLVECKICHERFRADQEIPEVKDHKHELGEEKEFNEMFPLQIGPTKESGSMAYLRPETAQGMFTNFKQILETSRVKPPFGIAQIGKSFRNEITTGEFIFRLREFEIAELEYFVKPGTEDGWFEKWVGEWEQFFVDYGVKKENMKRYEHSEKERAHYSKGTTDILFKFPVGWKELAGIANRTDFDLVQHEKASNKELRFFDEEEKKAYRPYVIEPTFGLERAFLAFLTEAYKEYPAGRGGSDASVGTPTPPEGGRRSEQEIVLHLDPRLAPYKVAVFPLVKKEKLPEIAQKLTQELRKQWFVQYDESGSIGRRYRRADEIGTPWCITVDFDTQKDDAVTIRDRDTMKQERVKLNKVSDWIAKKLDK